MIIIILIILIIVYIRYDPNIDIVYIRGHKCFVLWYNNYKEVPTKRDYFIIYEQK